MGDLRGREALMFIWEVPRECLLKTESSTFFMVTTICFLGDVPSALRETYRVLHFGGYILIGMLDFVSPIGKSYAGTGGQ